MKGKIMFDISNDKDLNELCDWINNHQSSLELMTSFDGRYMIVEFEPKNSSK